MNDTGYGVGELSKLSGVSVRTLHHYDKLGLLVPTRLPNGYRRYLPADVRRLQQILLYRSCGMELSRIGGLLDRPDFDELEALESHLARLERQRRQLDQIIGTVQRTIAATRKGEHMADKERFEGLKQQAIEHNEKTYGRELRQRFGDETVDAANQALLQMDERTWNDMNALEGHILELLSAAMATNDCSGAQSQELVKAHARWLQLHWGPGTYSPEAHRGLADGYLADERFVAYYDSTCGQGATQFLHNAIHALIK